MDMRALSPDYKAAGKWPDQLYACGAETKNMWTYTSSIPYAFIVCRLIKYRYSFVVFTFLPWKEGQKMALHSVKTVPHLWLNCCFLSGICYENIKFLKLASGFRRGVDEILEIFWGVS